MARKPRSEWSPAYRRRVESAERKGKSRQEARGHRAREHVVRAARETTKRGYTNAQAARIDKFAREQARRGGGNADAASDLLKQWVTAHGYERFRELRAFVADQSRQKRRREKIRTREFSRGGRVIMRFSTGPGTAMLEDTFDDFELPDMPEGRDLGWLFYH